jgi:hypothetical protein
MRVIYLLFQMTIPILPNLEAVWLGLVDKGRRMGVLRRGLRMLNLEV